MDANSDKRRIMFISGGSSLIHRLEDYACGAGHTVDRTGLEYVEDVLLYRDHDYDCVVLDLVPGDEVFKDRVNQIMQSISTDPVPVIFAGKGDDRTLERYSSNTGASNFVISSYQESRLGEIFEKAFMYQDDTRRLRQFCKLVEREHGKRFLWGPSAVMRGILLRCIDQIVSGGHLVLTGEPGTGKRTLARALRVYFPKHRLLEIDCDLIFEYSGSHASDFISTLLEDSEDMYEEEDTDSGLFILITNLHQLMRTWNQFHRTFFQGLKEFIKTFSGDVLTVITGTQDLTDWMRANTTLKWIHDFLRPLIETLPPLSSRKDDIPFFAKHFMEISAKRYNMIPLTLDSEMEQVLINDIWSGNLYELDMVMRRAILLSHKTDLPMADRLFLHRTALFLGLKTFRVAKNDFERQYLIDVLLRAKGNVSRAARFARKERKDLYYLMKKHHIVARDIVTR